MTVLKAIGPPGSVSFVGCCLLLGGILAWVWPRNKRLARNWLWGVVTGHTLLALPLVANAIANTLPRVSASSEASVQNLDTLFVLDGDNRRGRVRSAAEAARASPASAVHILGGSPWLLDALVEAGVARSRIAHDFTPEDTRQQMDELYRLLGLQPQGQSALVASRLQMPRVAGLARAAGFQTMLIASPIDTEPPTTGWRLIVPSYYALRVSRDAIYEHAALAYYDWRGWIQTEGQRTDTKGRFALKLPLQQPPPVLYPEGLWRDRGSSKSS